MLLREFQLRGYSGRGSVSSRPCLAPFKRQPEEPLVSFERGGTGTADTHHHPPWLSLAQGLRCYPRGYSRATLVRFSDREDSEAWLNGLRATFPYIGGVTELALFDNVGTIILASWSEMPTARASTVGIPGWRYSDKSSFFARRGV